MRRRPSSPQPGQTVSGGYYGCNESATTMRHTIHHVDEDLHEPYVNAGSTRGVEWRERDPFSIAPSPYRRGRRY